jgi:hypothetical protein
LQVPKLSETIDLREVQSRSLPVVLRERLHCGARAVLRYRAQFGSFDVAESHLATWRRGMSQPEGNLQLALRNLQHLTRNPRLLRPQTTTFSFPWWRFQGCVRASCVRVSV